jgi:DNA adenine methylase
MLRDRIIISNIDGCEFIANFNPINSKNLIYIDPPYFQKGNLLYMNFLTPKDHASLCKCIKKCPFAWVLSYDNRKEILTLYEGINTYLQQLLYTIVQPSIGNELIISNLVMPKSLIQINGGSFASKN